jgi:exodeoxyribonuclease VII small subunit
MKPKKKSAAPVLDRNGLTFEQAIGRLEKIVADMEAAELPLEDVLRKYEEGTRLVRFCNLKLEEAEKKIEVLTKKADGTVALEPFETEPGGTEEDKSEDEGGKLF